MKHLKQNNCLPMNIISYPINWKYFQFLLIVFSCLYLTACDSEKRQEVNFDKVISEEETSKKQAIPRKQSFLFGFDQRRELKEDIRQYAPFLLYLEQETGYAFELRISPEESSLINDLGNGVIHFAAVGAGSYLKAHAEYGVLPLVRGINHKGKAEYRAAIITRPDSDIEEVKDIKGRTFGFGSLTSTQGHLIPRIMLAENEILLTDLKGYEWTGSHYNCADKVSSGAFDAGGIQDTLAVELEKKGQIRIIAFSDFFPSSGIAMTKKIDSQVVQKVKKALLSFSPKGEHAQGLYAWDKTEMPNGFKEAQESDYDDLLEWSKEFGILEAGL